MKLICNVYWITPGGEIHSSNDLDLSKNCVMYGELNNLDSTHYSYDIFWLLKLGCIGIYRNHQGGRQLIVVPPKHPRITKEQLEFINKVLPDGGELVYPVEVEKNKIAAVSFRSVIKGSHVGITCYDSTFTRLDEIFDPYVVTDTGVLTQE